MMLLCLGSALKRFNDDAAHIFVKYFQGTATAYVQEDLSLPSPPCQIPSRRFRVQKLKSMAYAQGDAPSLPPPQSISANSKSTEKAREADAGAREVRSGALRLLAAVLARFPAACDYGPYWPRFFAAIAPLLPRLLVEVRPLSNCDFQPGWFRILMLLLQPPPAAFLRCDCVVVAAAPHRGSPPLQLRIPTRVVQNLDAVITAPTGRASLLRLPRCYRGCLWRCASQFLSNSFLLLFLTNFSYCCTYIYQPSLINLVSSSILLFNALLPCFFAAIAPLLPWLLVEVCRFSLGQLGRSFLR